MARPLSAHARLTGNVKPEASYPRRLTAPNNKHTLELQFHNKKKMLSTLTNSIMEKHNSALQLYEDLVTIKHKLSRLGKNVMLEELIVVNCQFSQELKEHQRILPLRELGAGEAIPAVDVKTCLEETPRKLMEICHNLLNDRSSIEELLEKVATSEMTVDEFSRSFHDLKLDSSNIQDILRSLTDTYEEKVNDFVVKRLAQGGAKIDKRIPDADGVKKYLKQNKFLLSQAAMHDKVIKDLEQKIKTLEHGIDCEKKTVSDFKTRTAMNVQTINILKSKIRTLESKIKTTEEENNSLTKKIKNTQDSLKVRETKWLKERDEMRKNMKEKDQILQNMLSERQDFELKRDETDAKAERLEGYITEMRELNKQMAEVDKQLKREREDKLEIQVQCEKMTMELIHIHKNIEYQREFAMMHQGPFCLTAINVNDIKNEVPKQNLELDNLLKRVNQLEKERLEKVNVQKKDESVEVLDNNSIIVDRHLWDNMNKFIVLKSKEISELKSQYTQMYDLVTSESQPPSEIEKLIQEYQEQATAHVHEFLENQKNADNFLFIISDQLKRINEIETMLCHKNYNVKHLKRSREVLLIEKNLLFKFINELRKCGKLVIENCTLKDQTVIDLKNQIDYRDQDIAKLKKEVANLSKFK